LNLAQIQEATAPLTRVSLPMRLCKKAQLSRRLAK